MFKVFSLNERPTLFMVLIFYFLEDAYRLRFIYLFMETNVVYLFPTPCGIISRLFLLVIYLCLSLEIVYWVNKTKASPITVTASTRDLISTVA